MDADYWKKLDERLERQQKFILTDEERNRIGEQEKRCYDENIESIRSIVLAFQNSLIERGFDTKLKLDKNGFMFRYARTGYFGPAGYKIQAHVDGPLVLAHLNPTGSASQYFVDSDLINNCEIGAGYDPKKFQEFLCRDFAAFLSPKNLISTRERRAEFESLQASGNSG